MLQSSAEMGKVRIWRSKGLIIVATVVAVVLVGSLVAIGCSRTGDDGGLPPESGGEASNEALLTKVTEILQIDQQKLEEAFAQARSEEPVEAPGGRQPWAPMARVAEILGIEQQDLQDAFAQARGEMPNGVPRNRPTDGNPGPRGAKGE
jgi:hypothetical protein